MNCENFETIVNDLARVKVMDAVARERGLAHAETCERCAARLAKERSLTAGLRALSACDERNAEPDNVEAALIEAFRAQASSSSARRLPVQSWSWPRWSWAAAAAILIACGFVVYRTMQNESRKDNGAITTKTPAPPAFVKREAQETQVSVASAPRREGRASRLRHRNPHRNLARRDTPVLPETVVADEQNRETTTEFFPLRFGSDHPPMESGEVIRVQMSRSALIALGLPVAVERADEPVKADLLIGEDGQARAIRFVR